MKVRVNLERLTLDDFLAVEDMQAAGRANVRTIRDILARFAVDEDGTPIPENEAVAAAGRLTLAQLNEVLPQIKAGIDGAVNKAIPPQTGGNSSQQSSTEDVALAGALS